MADVTKICGFTLKDEEARKMVEELSRKLGTRQQDTFTENVNIGSIENGMPVFVIYNKLGNNGERVQVYHGFAADDSGILTLYVDGHEENYIKLTKNGIETKKPIPVESGGTGESSLPALLEKMGAVKKTGDKMSGSLTVPFMQILSNNLYPGITFQAAEQDEASGTANFNANTRRFYITANCADSDHNETYAFPVPDTGRTGNGYFYLLTTKEPVSVANGGTGAKNKADALRNLGFEVQTGTLESVGTSGTVVTFERAFSAAPVVLVSGGSEQTSVRVTDVTPTGCTIISGASGNHNVQYLAVNLNF